MKFLNQNVLMIWSFLLMVDMIVCNIIQPDESSVIAKRQTKDTETSSCRGLPGLPGRDGRDGRDAGLRGLPGKPGKSGPAGPPGARGAAGGVVFTRWGRKHCPQTSETNELYSGVMGGSYYLDAGGGSNYLCLPLNPIFNKTTSGVQGFTYIHGTEYEINSQTNIFPKNVHNHNAPCAVCYAESRGSHLMLPARNVCPSNWTLEYKGYLMTANYRHKRTQFICVDENPEGTTGSHSDRNGALLYFVEGYCGHSLPCPPYSHGKELTCAVCTK